MADTKTVRRTPWTWLRDGGWYFLVVIGSFGLLSPVPFAHAATRLRSAVLWAATAGYTVAIVSVFVLAAVAPKDASGRRPVDDPITSAQVLITLGTIVVACLHLRSVRRRAYRIAPPGQDAAVAAALARRQRRQEARRLAASDPELARELRIGRPDLPREYDDGGLVDLNHAPAESIAELCAIERRLAEQLVATRVDGGGTLTSVEDLFAYVDLPPALWDRVRDRGIVVGGWSSVDR